MTKLVTKYLQLIADLDFAVYWMRNNRNVNEAQKLKPTVGDIIYKQRKSGTR